MVLSSAEVTVAAERQGSSRAKIHVERGNIGSFYSGYAKSEYFRKLRA